jgi:hypothetical protein
MKTTNEIKKWLKTKLGLTVKGNTSSGKSQWQCFRVPPDKDNNFAGMAPLKYSLPMFPPEFCQMCIKIVYPNSPTLHTQTRVNNIDARHVDMLPHEWEAAIVEWERTHPAA